MALLSLITYTFKFQLKNQLVKKSANSGNKYGEENEEK